MKELSGAINPPKQTQLTRIEEEKGEQGSIKKYVYNVQKEDEDGAIKRKRSSKEEKEKAGKIVRRVT